MIPNYSHEGGRVEGKANTADSLIAMVQDCAKLIGYPVTVKIDEIDSATAEQNRMQFQWFKDAANQSKETGDPEQQLPEYWRGYCKAFCGVPILLRDNDSFRERYEKIVKPLPYETKIELMRTPFDFPVTRLMSKKQKSEYLEAVKDRLTNKHGFQLTEPEQ